MPTIEVYTTKEGLFQLVNADCCQANLYKLGSQGEADWNIKLTVSVSHIEEFNSETGFVRVKKESYAKHPE